MQLVIDFVVLHEYLGLAQEVLYLIKSTLLGCAHLCNGTKILEGWAPI